MAIPANSLVTLAANGHLCKLFGIRLVTNPAIVHLAQNAGFDGLFIELEHSTLSLDDANHLCMSALLAGITPFVRVPYQCGYGFIQRVLDGGAMGVIFPHIHNKDDAAAAVKISKYPPQGCRSMTGQLPLFGLRPTPTRTIVLETNANASSVVLMVETRDAVNNADDIAAVEGVDCLLIGSNDLSIELGVPGDFKHEAFRSAVAKVGRACEKYNKVLGFAGIYEDAELQAWVVKELGARLILGQQDSGIIAGGGKRCADALNQIVTSAAASSLETS